MSKFIALGVDVPASHLWFYRSEAFWGFHSFPSLRTPSPPSPRAPSSRCPITKINLNLLVSQLKSLLKTPIQIFLWNSQLKSLLKAPKSLCGGEWVVYEYSILIVKCMLVNIEYAPFKTSSEYLSHATLSSQGKRSPNYPRNYSWLAQSSSTKQSAGAMQSGSNKVTQVP